MQETIFFWGQIFSLQIRLKEFFDTPRARPQAGLCNFSLDDITVYRLTLLLPWVTKTEFLHIEENY